MKPNQKAKLVKKFVRADNQKMKKGGYHNTNKDDVNKMRKNKKKDIQSRLDEASITSAVKGYLSSMKAASAPEGEPWYLRRDGLKHSLSESLKLLKEEEDDKFIPYEKRSRDILRTFVKPGEKVELDKDPLGPSREKELSRLGNKEIPTGNVDPRDANIGPLSKSQEFLPQFARELYRKQKAGELPTAKDIAGPMKDKYGDEYRVRGLTRGLGSKAQAAKDGYLNNLDARNFIIDQKGGPSTPEERMYVVLGRGIDELESKGMLDAFLKTKFTSYSSDLTAKANEFLRSVGKGEIRTRTSERGDSIIRLFADEAPPNIILPFVHEFLEDPEAVIKPDLRRMKNLAIAGRKGMKADGTVGNIGTGVDNEVIDLSNPEPSSGGWKKRASRKRAQEEPTYLNIDDIDMEGEDDSLDARGDRSASDPLRRRERAEDRDPDEFDLSLDDISMADMFDREDMKALERDEQFQTDLARIRDIHRKADRATDSGEITSRKADAAGISGQDQKFLASKVLFNKRVKGIILDRLARRSGIDKDRLDDVLNSLMVIRTGKDGSKYFDVRNPYNKEIAKNLPPDSLEAAKLLYAHFNIDAFAESKDPQTGEIKGGRQGPTGGNIILNYLEDFLRREDEESLRAAGTLARQKLYRDRREEARAKRQRPERSPEERQRLISKSRELRQRGKGNIYHQTKMEPVLRDRLDSLKSKLDSLPPDSPDRNSIERRIREIQSYLSRDKIRPPRGDKKEQRKEKIKSDTKELFRKGMPTFLSYWKKTGMEASEVGERLREFGLSKDEIKSILSKYKNELKESKMPMTMENLKSLVRRDFNAQPSLAEMLLSKENPEKEEETEFQSKAWDKAKLAKKKNFYSKLSLSEAYRRL